MSDQLSEIERRGIEWFESLPEIEQLAIAHTWEYWARPKQLPPPGQWFCWLILAGRGFGKTRTGAEYMRHCASKGLKHLTIAGPTAGDIRDVMIEGESGIMATAKPWLRPRYEPSKRRVEWPNGARALLVSADEPERFRGKQHEVVWADEVGSWRYDDAWDQIKLGLRLGEWPRVVVTTTPKPTRVIKDLVKQEDTVVVTGSSYENRANLTEVFFRTIVSRYEGTRLGRQEIYAEILEDVPGAIVTRSMIDDARRKEINPGDLDRIVIAVDPAVSNTEDSDEHGILVCGRQGDRGFVLEDASLRGTPEQWARRAIQMRDKHEADAIVVEVNQGGDMVESVLRQVDRTARIIKVRASRGKHVRFEPVGALYEQGRIHHVGNFPVLEEQLCSFTTNGYEGTGSPDHADALVWAFTDLIVDRRPVPKVWKI